LSRNDNGARRYLLHVCSTLENFMALGDEEAVAGAQEAYHRGICGQRWEEKRSGA
jgi:hypothetical protein